jgi:mono/diheme cytochrome c family protein
MKKVLKWVGIVLGALVVIVLIAIGSLYFLGGQAFDKVYSVPDDKVTIPTGADAIARGKHIAITHACVGCHKPDFSGGGFSIDDPQLITIVAPNLTAGQGGVGGSMTDADWVKAIRYGIDKKGHTLFIMPSEAFHNFNDEDLGDLIAYLKSVQPVDNTLTARRIGTMGRLLLASGQLVGEADIVQKLPPPAAPVAPGPSAEYGKYIASTLCIVCHGANLAGAMFPPGQPGGKLTPNLTPGGELLVWSQADFVKTLRGGVTPSGQTLNATEMPWKEIGQMSDDELAAVYAYLKSLPKTPSPTPSK